MRKIILHLCADIGSDSKPYQEAGYDVRLIGKDIGVENYSPPKETYGIIANPPCQEFSTASNFNKKGDLEKGLFLVNHCIRIMHEVNPIALKFFVLENPANGRLKEILGKPQMTYQPWQYGSPWTKKTSLWGFFHIPEPKYLKFEDCEKNNKLYIRPGRKIPSLAILHKSSCKFISEFSSFKVNSDADFRSLCSQGFAKSFFDINQ